MAAASLSSASVYLNNLLLARGLLQDGKSIDFAHPGADNLDHTMSRVINLVHDLVLRRDREAEQRENLVSNLRALRAEEAQRVIDLQRALDKHVELTREMTTAQSQERNAKAALKKSEAHARELREQMLKMKSTLDHVRAKCVGDIRKRDVELEKLKGHLANMQRGKRETSGIKINTINPQAFAGKAGMLAQDADTTDWSLEKETNGFLAALVNETSTENVSLRNIVTETMDVLRELTGLEADTPQPEQDPIGVPGQYRPSRQQSESRSSDSIIPCEALASQMTAILEHCRSILKDPSFVPIEEVQIREEEIIKLRIGWEKMANRWKEAVTMMDNWRRKMLDGKESIDVKELSSLEFGRSVAVMPNGEPVLDQTDELSAILFDHSRLSVDDDNIDMDSGASIEPPPIAEDESDLEIPPEPSPKRLAASPARRGIKLPKPTQVLGEVGHNSRRQIERPVKVEVSQVDGTAEDEENIAPDVTSKIPKYRKSKDAPAMSVSEKLAAVEAEAKQAEEVRQADGSHKRKPITKPTRKNARRRSTLSPEELALLMGVR
jgi:hypothetical protein